MREQLDKVSDELDSRLDRRRCDKCKDGEAMRQSEKVKVFISQATNYANAWIGTPYKWGGEAIGDGVDCSGLVRRILTRSLPGFPANDMTAQGIMDKLISIGNEIEKGYETVEAGHILFFGRDIYHVTHVGYAVTPWHMIEAGGGGSRTRTREDAMNQGAWVRNNLIEKRSDLCAHIDPWENV